MRAVYVAGPLGSSDTDEALRNCHAAVAVAHRLSLAGFAVVCVHALAGCEIAAIGSEVTGDRLVDVLDQDLELLSRCDAVVLVTADYAGSKGTDREVRAARALGIPVFTMEQALAWGSKSAA